METTYRSRDLGVNVSEVGDSMATVLVRALPWTRFSLSLFLSSAKMERLPPGKLIVPKRVEFLVSLGRSVVVEDLLRVVGRVGFSSPLSDRVNNRITQKIL